MDSILAIIASILTIIKNVASIKVIVSALKKLFGWGDRIHSSTGTGKSTHPDSISGEVITVKGRKLAVKLAWLERNAVSGGSYVIKVNKNERISSRSLSYNNKHNITITIMGFGAKRTIQVTSKDSMFFVDAGVTLVLDSNITLKGRSNNYKSLVYVESGGILKMNVGSAITGNTTRGNGGGVYVGTNGFFRMNGGTISGNAARGNGGGVYVDTDGSFFMYGGAITGNTLKCFNAAYTDDGTGAAIGRNDCGGGVYVRGAFTMNGGTISGNTARDGGGVFVWNAFTMNGGEIISNKASEGGGVYVEDGAFIMGNRAAISQNRAGGSGGGVYVRMRGRFLMIDGIITNNNAGDNGGGVYVSSSFTMIGGNISSNTACRGGGLVLGGGGSFTMNEGIITGNVAFGYDDIGYAAIGLGGGVWVLGGVFLKKGGTITGIGDAKNLIDDYNRVEDRCHTVRNDRGHAIYCKFGDRDWDKRRETTAGPDENLFFDGHDGNPTWYGGWDK